MRELRETAIWLIAADFLMIAAAAILTFSPTTSEPFATAMVINAVIFAALSIAALSIACLGITVAIMRWRKSK